MKDILNFLIVAGIAFTVGVLVAPTPVHSDYHTASLFLNHSASASGDTAVSPESQLSEDKSSSESLKEPEADEFWAFVIFLLALFLWEKPKGKFIFYTTIALAVIMIFNISWSWLLYGFVLDLLSTNART